jgi:hypothetical protein
VPLGDQPGQLGAGRAEGFEAGADPAEVLLRVPGLGHHLGRRGDRRVEGVARRGQRVRPAEGRLGQQQRAGADRAGAADRTFPGLRPGRLDRHGVGQRVRAGVAGRAGRKRGRVQGPAARGLPGRLVVAQLGAGGQGGQPTGPPGSVPLRRPAQVGHRGRPRVVEERGTAVGGSGRDGRERGEGAHALGVAVGGADGQGSEVDGDGAGQGGERAGATGGGTVDDAVTDGGQLGRQRVRGGAGAQPGPVRRPQLGRRVLHRNQRILEPAHAAQPRPPPGRRQQALEPQPLQQAERTDGQHRDQQDHRSCHLQRVRLDREDPDRQHDRAGACPDHHHGRVPPARVAARRGHVRVPAQLVLEPPPGGGARLQPPVAVAQLPQRLPISTVQPDRASCAQHGHSEQQRAHPYERTDDHGPRVAEP